MNYDEASGLLEIGYFEKNEDDQFTMKTFYLDADSLRCATALDRKDAIAIGAKTAVTTAVGMIWVKESYEEVKSLMRNVRLKEIKKKDLSNAVLMKHCADTGEYLKKIADEGEQWSSL